MKWRLGLILTIVFFLSLQSLFIPCAVADPTIMVSDYQLSPEIFMPGDSGILTFTLINAESTSTTTRTTTSGSTTTVNVDTVGATIDNIWILPGESGEYQVGATTNYEDIGDIAPGSSIDLSFLLMADENISEGMYFPTIRVAVESYADVNYPFLVKVSNSTVNLLKTDVPSKISVSGSTLLTLTAVNNRANTVDGVTILPVEQEGVEFTPNSIYIGSLESESSSDASFSVKPSETGDKNITFQVQFKNGDNLHTENLSIPIEIVETLDVSPVFTSIFSSIKKGSSTRISLDVYNAKTESITGVIVTPITDATVIPSQYFIGSMDPDDVFSASFNFYSDTLEYGNHTIGFKVSFKQGSDYYETPAVSSSFSVLSGEGSSYEPLSDDNNGYPASPGVESFGYCLIIIPIIILVIVVYFIWRWMKRRKS